MRSRYEYAHGVPGVPKNALDWVVASSELVDKPVALIDTSTHAWASLADTLSVMSERVVLDASMTVSLGTECCIRTRTLRTPKLQPG